MRNRRLESSIVALLAVASVFAAWLAVAKAPAGLIGRYWEHDPPHGVPARELGGMLPSADDVARLAQWPAQAGGLVELSGAFHANVAGRHRFDLRTRHGGSVAIDAPELTAGALAWREVIGWAPTPADRRPMETVLAAATVLVVRGRPARRAGDGRGIRGTRVEKVNPEMAICRRER